MPVGLRKSRYNMKQLKSLEDIMTREVITLRPSDSLAKALDYFESHSIHHLLVTDGKNGKLLGVLSKKDILNFFLTIRAKSDELSFPDLGKSPVSDAMTEDPLFLDPSDSVGLAADIVLSNKFHSLPIVEDGKLAGIVTSHDLLKFAFERIPVEDYGEFSE